MANILFFLSGAASLIYQIIWIRQSSLVFGSSIAAISATTAVFFGGLALGNYLIVRKPRVFTSNLYAKLEFLLVIFGLLSILQFSVTAKIFFENGFFGVIPQIILTLVAVGFPTIIMGATFPVMVGLAKENSAEKQIAGVYLINSLGAVFGAILCGFFLLQYAGIRNSIFIAAAINVSVGFLALFLFKKSVSPQDLSQKTFSSISVLPVILFAFVGFNGMLAELVASRFLALIITNTIFVYTLTISSVICGLALGAGLFAKFSDKFSPKYNCLGFLSLSWASLLVIIFFLTPTNFWMNTARTLSMPSILLMTALVSFLPSLLSGAMFPAAVKIIQNGSAEKIAGILSSANTVGAIIGSLLCGFVFLPVLGVANTVLLGIIISLIVAVVAILKYSEKRIAKFSILWILVPVALFTFGQGNYKNFIKNYLSFDKKSTLLSFAEGREAVVSVTLSKSIKTMEIDRLWQGENRKTRQIMAAHIPTILLKEDPKNALLIGFGTGLTAKRFLDYGVENLVCVDIEKTVFDFAKKEFNADFLSDEKVKILVEDGRNTVKRKDKKFDIISVEIGQIFRPYCAGFYTKEFYENAEKILSENGIITQFVPIASFNYETFQSVIKTFISVFENSQLWYNGSEFLLMGTKGEFSNLSDERAKNIFSKNQKVMQDLHWSYWGGTVYPLSEKRIFAANFLFGKYDLVALAFEGEIFTDELPKLEYYAAANRQNPPFIDSLNNYLSPVEYIIPEVIEKKDLDGIEGIRKRNLGDIIANELLVAYLNQPHPAPAILEEALEKYNPLNLHILAELASIYYEMGEYEKSAGMSDRASKLEPRNSLHHRQYALAAIKLDYQNLAVDRLLTAIDIAPNDFVAHTMLAGLMIQRNSYDLAMRHVTYALSVNSNYAEALRMYDFLRNNLEETPR
ncbi:MAG: fused MFS/spermidine synthase [Chitinivibrionia bacterium]|nr:fused MFS/spermidine synthase [Chitinivibrionia bacterium]